MITEAEAKTKMCPILEARSHLRQGDRMQTCHGSVCMMWRWGLATSQQKKASDPKGYCGMAGKP